MACLKDLDGEGNNLPCCEVHAALDARGTLELEIGNKCVACSPNERAELLKILAPHVPVDDRSDSVGFLRLKLAHLKKEETQ
jgi:hypothetical protein